MREWAREKSRSICRGTEHFYFFLSLSTLGNKWSGAKTERETKEREKLLRDAPDCAVTASRAPFLPAVTSPASDRWHSTSQEDLGGSLQEHIHLRPNLSRTSSISSHRLLPHSSSHPIYTVSIVSHILHLAPDFTPHLAAAHFSLSPLLSLSFFSFFFYYSFSVRCTVIENPCLCLEKGEICESMLSRWRRGSLRIVLYWMCQALKKMC